MNFGINLKTLMEESQITQNELAKSIGFTQRAISKWVNLQSEPTETAIIKIANYFNVSVDYLLGRTDELGAPVTLHQDLTKEERSFLELFRQLSRGERAQLLAFSAGLLGKKRPDMKFWE